MLVHDLRSPLSVIIGVLELAAGGEFDANTGRTKRIFRFHRDLAKNAAPYK